MADIALTRDHSGGAVAARTGDAITVALPETPSTGYRWSVAECSEGVVRARESAFTPSPTGRPGAPGERRLVFEVTGAGSGRISLRLHRRWSADDEPADRFDVAVTSGG